VRAASRQAEEQPLVECEQSAAEATLCRAQEPAGRAGAEPRLATESSRAPRAQIRAHNSAAQLADRVHQVAAVRVFEA